MGGHAPITSDLMRSVEPVALLAYRENVLVPVLSKLPPSLTDYLRAMCEVEGEDGRARTGDVARRLGKRASQVSGYRARLIKRRLIEADGQGYARLLLPHVDSFYRDEIAVVEQKDPNQQWNRHRR